jgi:predicted anti-sigma-YlaC factor YlaD
MNCRAAQRLISAERDAVLAASERSNLEAHLAACGDCRQFRAIISEAAEAWRASTMQLRVPDAERSWQAIRREIRAGEAGAGRPAPRSFRWMLPLGAGAALAAVVLILAPQWRQRLKSASELRERQVARVDFVEVPDGGSSMVYIDDKSGWLVVWAVDPKQAAGG